MSRAALESGTVSTTSRRVVRLEMPVASKFLLLTFLSFVASILAYEALRHTVVGRLLLGLRRRAVVFE